MNGTLQRPALYYPYIHIRSEHWLKATLLCVPSVKRIVPEGYTPEDSADIIKYTTITGPNGTLLQAVPSASSAAYESQLRLLQKLHEHEEEIERKYARSHAPTPDEYWIHEAKFNHELLSYLQEHNLAWSSEHIRPYGHRPWCALHPILGSAIMTTLGLSIAREQHYDIVTPSVEFHEALLATKEDAIFDALLKSEHPKPNPTTEQTRLDLGELVITLSGINYQALRPEDIPELQSSKHFNEFQHLIRAQTQLIDRNDEPESYKAQLRDQAEEIIESWHETRSELSSSLKDILFDASLILSPDILKALIKGPDSRDLAIAGGVAVCLLVKKGFCLSRKEQHPSPYQYLTEVTRAQNESLRVTFPLGLEA